MPYFISRPARIVYVLLGLIISLMVILPVKARFVSGAEHNRLGFEYLRLGQAEQAFEEWEKAEQQYQVEGSKEGVRGSQLNQAIALHAMGSNIRACYQVVELLALPTRMCTLEAHIISEDEWKESIENVTPGGVEILALNLLGSLLRESGYLPGSKVILNTALSVSKNQESFPRLQLSMAATQAALGMEALKGLFHTAGDLRLEQRRVRVAMGALSEASALYENVSLGNEIELAVVAKVEEFSLLCKVKRLAGKLPAMMSLMEELKAPLQRLATEVKALNFEDISLIDGIYMRLKASEAYTDIGTESTKSIAEGLTWKALADAKTIENKRAESFAYGRLAALAKSDKEQIDEYETALALAKASASWDAAFRWAAELGSIYKNQDDPINARANYEEAIDSINLVRENMTGASVFRQSGFDLELVRPVFKNYMKLVKEPSKLISTYQSLERLELEDYLNCRVDFSYASTRVEEGEAIVYLLDLDEEYVVIGKRKSTETVLFSLKKEDIEPAIQNLRTITSSPNFIAVPEGVLLQYSQDIYRALIKPLEEQEFILRGDTLILAPDISLRNIPYSLLNNGSEYLIERYNISSLLGEEITGPPRRRQGTALVAGISETSPSFSSEIAPAGLGPLPQVEEEILLLKERINGKFMLNKEFTAEQIQEEIAEHPIVHLSTHGQFSSDPDRTLLMAWDQVLNTYSLYEIFDTFGEGRRAVDLLVLSACQTAAGDERAMLGIAGIGAQSGARSTLASLWLIDANSTVLFMDKFYEEYLKGEEVAKAVRMAQLALIRSREYSHPFFWSSFLLIGDWR